MEHFHTADMVYTQLKERFSQPPSIRGPVYKNSLEQSNSEFKGGSQETPFLKKHDTTPQQIQENNCVRNQSMTASRN